MLPLSLEAPGSSEVAPWGHNPNFLLTFTARPIVLADKDPKDMELLS